MNSDKRGEQGCASDLVGNVGDRVAQLLKRIQNAAILESVLGEHYVKRSGIEIVVRFRFSERVCVVAHGFEERGEVPVEGPSKQFPAAFRVTPRPPLPQTGEGPYSTRFRSSSIGTRIMLRTEIIRRCLSVMSSLCSPRR